MGNFNFKFGIFEEVRSLDLSARKWRGFQEFPQQP